MQPETPQQPSVTNQAIPAAQPVVTPPAAVPGPLPAPETKKRIPKWLKIVLIVFGCFIALAIIGAVIGGVVAVSATKAPQKVSDQFVNDVQSGDTSAAYALTSSSFQGATSQDQLDTLIKRIGPLVQGQEKITGRTIAKSTGIPTTAVLVYSVPTSNGTKYIKTELQKNNSTWQIINFRSDDKPLDTTVE